jgi:hypothetical protein
MAIRDWLDREFQIAEPDLTTYTTNFTNHGITEETMLQRLGITLDDLKEMKIKLGHRHRIFDAIRVMAGTPERQPSHMAEARRDLIKRLLPVAISVGFASRLIEMPWAMSGDWPDLLQLEELARFFTAMFLTVCGWEWYHRDVQKRPLESPHRFIVDVAIAILTIFFLYSSKHSGLWFCAFIAIFFLYVVWDWFSIREYPQDYGLQNVTAPAGPGDILRVYGHGFLNGTARGPITNLTWFVYFVVIAFLSWRLFVEQYEGFVSCTFVLIGAICILRDGHKQTGAAAAFVFGWTMQFRFLVVFISLVAFVLVSTFVLARSTGQGFPQTLLALLSSLKACCWFAP